MVKSIAIVVILLVGAVLAFAATRPDNFRVQRSTTIKAPPEKNFPLISQHCRVQVAKLMGLFVDMDAIIGNDFEAGLANLKAIAEK